ncbi:MAG: hypothetical protein KDK69_01910, partial [Chlamydiia bacterium]|nr:hypothetical protein [Chlamydiia bacterium]
KMCFEPISMPPLEGLSGLKKNQACWYRYLFLTKNSLLFANSPFPFQDAFNTLLQTYALHLLPYTINDELIEAGQDNLKIIFRVLEHPLPEEEKKRLIPGKWKPVQDSLKKAQPILEMDPNHPNFPTSLAVYMKCFTPSEISFLPPSTTKMIFQKIAIAKITDLNWPQLFSSLPNQSSWGKKFVSEKVLHKS